LCCCNIYHIHMLQHTCCNTHAATQMLQHTLLPTLSCAAATHIICCKTCCNTHCLVLLQHTSHAATHAATHITPDIVLRYGIKHHTTAMQAATHTTCYIVLHYCYTYSCLTCLACLERERGRAGERERERKRKREKGIARDIEKARETALPCESACE